VRFVLDPILQRGGEAALADTRLAGDRDHLSLATLGALPAPEQQLGFLLAAD
jgi:hypothetical protein